MKYKNWLNNWLDYYIKPTSKIKTYYCYREMIVNHIAPSMGDCEMSELTAFKLQTFVTEMLAKGNLRTGKGLSPNTVNSMITVMQNSLRMAHTLGLIKEYVADKIKRPKSKEKKVECFSFGEQKKIEKYIINSGKERLFGILLSLYTGLRIGEILALEWNDIDLDKFELNVNKTCYYSRNDNGKQVRIVDSPKTVSSIRTIPIPDCLVPLFKDIKRKIRSTLVVSNGDKSIAFRSYQRTFELMLKRLDIPHRGFHALRHTFATRALECGMDVKTLAEILGHKNPTVTLNRYAHSLTDHKREMMNTVGRLL